MGEFFQNPAVQAGLAPFVVALILARLLLNSRFLGLAQAAGFIVVIALIMGFSFEALTATRKLVLVGASTVVFVLLLEVKDWGSNPTARWVVAGLYGLSVAWVLFRVLQQRELAAALLAATAAVLYLATLVKSTLVVSADSVRGATVGLMLGLGSGALALLGASASLAQIGIAVGAASGAILLIQMVAGRRAPVGATLSLPASVTAGLVALLAAFTGELRWYCLLPMLAIPWAATIVPVGGKSVWLRAVLTAMATLPPLLLSVGLQWFTASTPAT